MLWKKESAVLSRAAQHTLGNTYDMEKKIKRNGVVARGGGAFIPVWSNTPTLSSGSLPYRVCQGSSQRTCSTTHGYGKERQRAYQGNSRRAFCEAQRFRAAATNCPGASRQAFWSSGNKKRQEVPNC